MGDLSAEPSMEEILSSIKRIIAEEGETPGKPRRAGRPSPSPTALAAAVDEVLELSDPMPATPLAAELSRRAQAQVAAEDRDPFPMAPDRDLEPVPERSTRPSVQAATMPAPPPEPAAEAAEPIVSPRTADASRGALDTLSRLMVKPEAGSDGTLEGLVREMLRPMLRDWLDAHLPPLVETMVAREIARITQER